VNERVSNFSVVGVAGKRDFSSPTQRAIHKAPWPSYGRDTARLRRVPRTNRASLVDAPEGHRADRQFAAPVVPFDVDGRMASTEYARKVDSADDRCTLNGELSPLSSPYNSV
jgi:hypothetical protein